MSNQYIYNPGGGLTPHQPRPATNPWTNTQSSNQPTQHSNAWNPWTNPPTAVAPSNLFYHRIYQPVSPSDPNAYQLAAVRNPWNTPPTPTPSASHSFNWTHTFVHIPPIAGSVGLYKQSFVGSLWTDSDLNTCPFMHSVMFIYAHIFV